MFLNENTKFDPSKIEEYNQPLLPGATKIEAKYLKHAVKLLETYQEQRDILSDEEIKDTYNINLNNQIDKDVLLFEGKFHKGVKQLIRRKNQYSGQKHTKVEYEDSFKRLETRGIGIIKEMRSSNNTKYLQFDKKSIQDIATDPKSLDSFPKDVSFAEYNSKFNA